MNFQEYAENYEEINEWLIKNAPPVVVEGIKFIENRRKDHIKLLSNAIQTQEDFMIATSSFQEAMLGGCEKKAQKYKKEMNNLYQRILFLHDQLRAFHDESKDYRK